MSKIDQAIHDIHYIDKMAENGGWLTHIHPLSKVIVTFWYMVMVMSFEKYDFTGLAGMCLYLVILSILGEISVGRALWKLKGILAIVCMVGIANPMLDRAVVLHIGNIPVTGGILSMLTLVMKAVFAVLATYFLIVTTTIENVCFALRQLHVPKILVTLIMLIYRYITLMLKEVERITQAYSLRASGQKGIHYRVWGTLAGQMLLRSMDRAELVYESMTLRGFRGEFYVKSREKISGYSVLYGIVWVIILLLLRMFPLFEAAGHLIA